MLVTDRLLLRPFVFADYEAAAAGDAALADHLGATVATDWLEFSEGLHFWLERIGADPALIPWAMYGYFERATDQLVGAGGFKGRPAPDGSVEIGYGVAPAVRGQGLATEAAAALVQWAQAQPDVLRIIAHTLPAENPSTGVLQRLGFERTGTATDPDEGPVWRWELA